MEHNKLIDWMNESEKKLFAIIGKYLDEVKGNNKRPLKYVILVSL